MTNGRCPGSTTLDVLGKPASLSSVNGSLPSNLGKDACAAPIASKKDRASAAQLADVIFRLRRDRDARFAVVGVHFGEPSWDIMLDLYRAHHDGERIPISSACIAASVPATTGLRHLVELERSGLVERNHDQVDRRRWFVSLTTVGLTMMDKWLARVAGGEPCRWSPLS